MPIFESTFGGQKKRYNIPADKVEEFKGKRPDAIEVTSKPAPIETIGFGVRRAGEITKLGAESLDHERAVAETIPQWPERPGERTRRGISEYKSALKKTNDLLKNPNLTPEQKQDVLYKFKIAYGTLNPDDNPRITQDARAYLEQEGAGDVASQFKSFGNAFSLDRGWDISGRLKDLGAGLGLTQDPATMIREREKVKNYLGNTAAGQRDVRAEQDYLAYLDRLEKELEEKIRAFEKEKIAGRRPKSDYAEMIQTSVGAIPFGSHSEEDKAAIPVSDSYEKDAAILETAKRELKKIRDTKERFFDAKNKGRFRQMLGEIYRRGDDTISETATLGVRGSLAEKEKNLALKDGEGNIAREASELAMETERMYEHDATISQMITSGAMESIPYMAEFAVTRGAAKLLKPATAARIAELGAKGGLKAAAKIAYHNANLAATMTVLQPSTYARAYEIANEDAVVNGTPAGGGLDFLGKAITEQFITNASESAGDVFGSLRVKNAGGKVSRWKNVRKQVANITGLHGIPSEFMEEKTEEVGQALTGVGDTTWADVVNPKRNVIMLGTVTFSQLPVQTITAMGYAAGKANNALTIRSIRKGYNRNVSNMVDVFGDESKEAMETVEAFVTSHGSSQEAVKAFDQAIVESDEYTGEEKSAMLNYAMSYAPMVGVDKEARERAEGYVAKATGAIEQSVNKDMDAVVTIRMDKNAAVVVGGKIVQKEDGSIDKDNSDKTLYYRDEEGRVHPIGIDAVDEVVESVPRAEALRQVSDAVSENVVKGTANAQAVERAVGEEVAFMVDGTSVVGMGVIQAMDEAGNYVVAMPDGTVSTIEPRQLVDEDVARMENGNTVLYTDADGSKKKGVVADSFNYQGQGLIVLEDGTKVPLASILGVLEEEKQEAMGETVDAPSEGASTDESPSEVEETPAFKEEVDAYADFPRKKSGEIDSAKLTDEQALVYAEREHGEEFAIESARAAIVALNKKRGEVSDKMKAEGSVAKRADMQSQIKGIDKRIGVYQEYLKNHEKAQDSAPSESEAEQDVRPDESYKELEAEVGRLSELFHTPVQVHYSPDTIQNATARKAAEDGLAKGWYVDGEVHIYLPNATGVEDIQETFFHEVVAHKGVKEMLGDKHNELLNALFDVLPEADQKRLLDLYGEKHVAADEYLAELAERGGFESKESRGIISKIVDAIREFLSRYHIQIGSPTAEEIANSLLKESAARLTEKRKEEDAQKFNGDILAYARDINKRNKLREAAKDVDKNPSKAQQEAGNYKKAHVNVQGFDITIENPKGSTRSGVDESGKEWSITMQNDYGYFKRSEGKDGDQIDVFIGNNPESGKIFVVDQVNPETGVFDESKVMLGFNSEEEAKKAYLSNYEEGWQGLGAITETDAEYFKEWLYDGKKQRKAFSEYAEVIGRYFDELKSFQKKTDMENRTSIDKEGYISEDLYAPLLLDGMPSKLGVETRIPDKITDPSYQVASYDYSDEIDQNTNEGWQKWSDLSDQYNAGVDDNLKAWDIGDTARFGFKSVDAAVRFSDWVKSRAEDKEVARKSSKDVLLSEEEYLDRELVAYYNSRDIKIPFDEWRDSEDSMGAENALLDSYPDYVKSLSESGTLQRIWDSAKLGDRIKIRKSVEAAGFNIHDMLDTKGAEEKPEPSASNGRPTRGVTTIRFYDGAIIRGDILSRKDGKVTISSSTGRYTVTEDREMPDYTGEEDVRFRGVSVNDRFNEELAKQVDGTLPRGHVYRLGMPGDALRSAGFPDLPIEMAASRLANKSNQENHPFDLSEVKDLPDAIQHPLAVFRSATRTGSYVVMTEIKQGDKNFVAAIEANRGMGKIEINSIRSLHPRTTTNVLSWVNEGLLNYADKKKLTDWVDEKIKTRSYLNSGTPADVRKQLVSAAKVIEGFENPKPSEENIDKPVYYAGKSILDYTSEIDAWNRKQKEKGDDIRFRLSDELQSIKERAISDGTFMKAPNGQPTKLNERQWLQVRTKAFKRWFGDWEKSARIEKLRKAKPVEITGEEVEPSDDLKQYKKNALEYGKTLRGEYTNKDTGEKIAIGKRGVKEVLQHDYKDREHLQSIAAIPQIIENSIYIDTLPNEDVDKNPDVKAYQYYVSGLKIGGEDYTARAAIAVDSQGNRYYDHKLTDIEKGELLNAMVGITNPVSQKTSPPSGYKDTKLISLLQTNSSKVVDENGEPLVVYHGTREDGFSIFDDMEGNKLSDAPEGVSFFTDMKSVAYTYSGRYDRPHYELEEDEEGVGSIYEVFLNIRDPRFEDFGGAGWDGQAWGKAALLDEENIEVYPNDGRRFFDSLSEAEDFAQEYDYQNYYVQKDPSVGYTTNEIAEEAMADGNDGAIFYDVVDVGSYGAEQESTVYVTFHPSQIKSATDNTGAFNEKNNDIRFRLSDGPVVDTEDLKKGIRRENRFQRTMDKFQEAYQDTYLPVKRLYERIEAQGVKVEDWENFYAQATHIPGKNQAEIEVYTSKYMNPMIEQVKVLQDKGFSYREIENYVMLKHGKERNEYMRERESAKYLKKHPRATAAKIDELKSKDYAGVRDIAKEVGDLGDIPEIGTAERIAAKFVHDVEVLCGDEAIGSFWDAVTAATRFSLTKSYHSGILSKAGYDELVSRYKYYVPLRGHDAITAEDKWDYISESGSPTFSSPIKRAKGRSSRAESPFAFIFQTAQSSIMAGNKNRLKSTLLNLAESGKAGTLFNISKSWYEKAGTDEHGNDAWQLAVPKYDEDPVVYSENIVSFEKRMKEEAKKGNAVQSRRKLDLDGMFIKPHQAAEHEIHIRRNGEDLVLYVNADPALARSVNGANRVISDSRFMHGARWSTRQIAAMSTSLNPLFTASNFMRDLQYSVVKLGVEKGGKFTAGYSVRLGRILFKDRVLTRMLSRQMDLSKKYDQYAYEFLMNGGKTGYVSALNLETTAHRIEKELKRLGVRELSALNPAKEAYLAGQCTRAMGDFFVTANEFAENSIRLAAYITARENGESIVSSVNTAKEVTVNFNRRGSGAMGADAINSLFMFTNVAFQALDNFAKIAKKHKWKLAATMAAYMFSGFLQSWWIDVFGSDDSKEAYWGTSDWDRQNNLCIPIGRGLFKIPHPQELRALRGLGVGIYQSIKGTKAPEDTALDLLSAVADVVPMGSTFVPAEASVSGVATAVSPTVLQPVTQWVANMNFKGNPVRNAYAPEYAPGHLQARTNRKGQPRADRWIYDLCEFINVSVGRGDGAKKGWIDLNPDAVQHFAGGYFGGLFNTASGTVNTIYMAQNGEAVRELRIRDTPLRRFYAETADMNNVDSGTMSKYYNISDKADQAHYMFGRYKKQLQDKSLTQEEYREKIEALNYPYWKSVRDQLSAIRRLERRLKDVAEDEQVKLDMKSAEMKRQLVKRYEKDMEVKHEE